MPGSMAITACWLGGGRANGGMMGEPATLEAPVEEAAAAISSARLMDAPELRCRSCLLGLPRATALGERGEPSARLLGEAVGAA